MIFDFKILNESFLNFGDTFIAVDTQIACTSLHLAITQSDFQLSISKFQLNLTQIVVIHKPGSNVRML